jgi:hypothetical protein
VLAPLTLRSVTPTAPFDQSLPLTSPELPHLRSLPMWIRSARLRPSAGGAAAAEPLGLRGDVDVLPHCPGGTGGTAGARRMPWMWVGHAAVTAASWMWVGHAAVTAASWMWVGHAAVTAASWMWVGHAAVTAASCSSPAGRPRGEHMPIKRLALAPALAAHAERPLAHAALLASRWPLSCESTASKPKQACCPPPSSRSDGPGAAVGDAAGVRSHGHRHWRGVAGAPATAPRRLDPDPLLPPIGTLTPRGAQWQERRAPHGGLRPGRVACSDRVGRVKTTAWTFWAACTLACFPLRHASSLGQVVLDVLCLPGLRLEDKLRLLLTAQLLVRWLRAGV